MFYNPFWKPLLTDVQKPISETEQAKEVRIPVEQFTVEGSYYLKLLSDRQKTFFLSLWLSALAGYETSNRGDKLLPDGATLLDKDCFIYGGALTLELETYLTDRVVQLVNARERMLFGSDIGKFHTQVGMGLKFIINWPLYNNVYEECNV